MLTSEDYQKADEKAIQLLLDYSFLSFPIDVFALAKKLNIKLVKYSDLDSAKLNEILSNSKTRDGLTVIKKRIDGWYDFIVYYNDKSSKNRQRFTIAHEIKHVVYLELDPSDDDEALANHFARVLLLPPCVLLSLNTRDMYSISEMFHISPEAAENALSALEERIRYHDYRLLRYEKNFLSQIIDKSIFRQNVTDSLSINYIDRNC